jgi:hypothetical protein
MWKVPVSSSFTTYRDFSALFEISFTGATTGADGIAFAYLVGPSGLPFDNNGTGEIAVNSPGEAVTNGDGCAPLVEGCLNKCNPQYGAAPLATDSGASSSGNERAYVVSQVLTAPLFDPKSKLVVHVRLDGLNQIEIVILRLDVRIKCWAGHKATGNLYGKLENAWYAPAGNILPNGFLPMPKLLVLVVKPFH